VQGRPEPPPPFKPERLYSNLRFNMTVSLDRFPGTERLLVGEFAGKVWLLPEDRDASEAQLFFDIEPILARLNRDNPEPVELESFYATAFDPDFEQNRWLYLFYIVRNKSRSPAQIPDGTRITRVKVSEGDNPVALPDTEEVLITWRQHPVWTRWLPLHLHRRWQLRLPAGYAAVRAGSVVALLEDSSHRSAR
jgi:hypothetical protein